MNTIGPQIKKIRLASQPPITQEALATKLQVLGWDIERFGVSKIERQVRQVTDKEVKLFAEALNVPVEKLFE